MVSKSRFSRSEIGRNTMGMIASGEARRVSSRLPLAASLIALIAGSLLDGAVARAGLFGGDQESRLWGGVSVRSWKLDGDGQDEVTIEQVSLPFSLVTPLPNEAVSITLSTTGAMSSYSAARDASLNGPTDTRLLMTYRMPNERLIVIGGLGLPTGVTDLDDEEVMVSRAVANQVLGFATSSYGAGFDVFGHLIGAWPLNDRWSVGGGIGYTLKGTYDYAAAAQEGLGELNPGDEVTISAGVSYHRETEELWSGDRFETAIDLDGTYRLLGADEVEGTEMFDEGDEIELTGAGLVKTTRTRYDLSFRAILKGDNSITGSATDLEADTGLESLILANVTGNWFEGAAGLTYRMTPVWDVGGRLDLRHFAETTTEGTSADNSLASRGTARVFGVGPVVGWLASDQVSLWLRASYLGGSAMSGDVSLSGFHVGASASIRF